jgi:hypothetical protein
MRVSAVVLVLSTAFAQEGYRKPSQAILDILNAPLTPAAVINPGGDAQLLIQTIRNPPIADLARPMLRLAGNRIDPAANGPHITQYAVGLSVMRIADGVETRIATPPGAKIASSLHSSTTRPAIA